MYESLARLVLPQGILEVFEVSNVEEEKTGIFEETGLERRISTSTCPNVTTVQKNSLVFDQTASPRNV